MPRQPHYQGSELFAIQLHFRAMANNWPVELSLVQATSSQPDPEAVMHQNFYASSAAIGEQISLVRLRRTEHRDHSG